MKFLRNFFGYFIASLVINGFWSIIVNKFGIIGGWISAFFLTGTMWFLNHYNDGLIINNEEAVFIDMALGIAFGTFFRDIFRYGIKALAGSMPTFICLSIGAVTAGIVSGIIEKNINKNKRLKLE